MTVQGAYSKSATSYDIEIVMTVQGAYSKSAKSYDTPNIIACSLA
jgi:hypothetical protein